MTAPADIPLRVSTLELFFDLVFAFTLTRLAALLADRLSLVGAVQVLLVFGVLWWMYGGYAWLTNARTPRRTPERLLLLLGMAGFLIAGLAIPREFGPGDTGSRLALGLGYLIVVAVHSALFYRVNRNIVRITPFNVTSALLVTGAAFTSGAVTYLLWVAAVAVQWLSPLIADPGGRFDVQPSHFAERHGALVIVALGESVAAIGVAAAPRGVTASAGLAAALGLALSAALWWVYFGDGDDERAAEAMELTPPHARARLALAAYYAHIPLLLGVVTVAAGAARTIGEAGRPHPAAQAVAVGGGMALFLAGSGWFRHALRLGPPGLRLAAAAFCVLTTVLGVIVSIEWQMAALLVAVAVMLGVQRWWVAAAAAGSRENGDRDRALHPPGDGPDLERGP